MAEGIGNGKWARWLAPVWVVMVVMQLAACGDSEGDQRKAFMEYLQNTVMRSGQNLPTLSEDQKQKFGNYANDYQVLLTFSHQVKQDVSNSLAPVINTLGDIRVPQDYVQQHDALAQELGALNMLGQRVQSAQAQADTAHAAMKHPEDLKAIYNQAYDSIVTRPANGLTPVIPALAGFAQEVVQVGDYLIQQGNQATFNGSQVQFPTQQQVTQYNTMMSGLATKQQVLQRAQNALNGQY